MIRNLLSAVDFRASELLGLDLAAAVGGAVGGSLIGLHHPGLLHDGLPVLAGLVGVMIGAVIAGVAVQGAFMDEAFLRKVQQIGRDPIRYVAPLLFTAGLGVLASLATVVIAFSTPTAPHWYLGTAAGVAGFLGIYTLTSVLSGLDTLVQFIGLKADAAALDAGGTTGPVAVPLNHRRRG